MTIKVSCACGKSYAIKDRFAGRQTKCPNCGETISVPALPDPIEIRAASIPFIGKKVIYNLSVSGESLSVRNQEGTEEFVISQEKAGQMVHLPISLLIKLHPAGCKRLSLKAVMKNQPEYLRERERLAAWIQGRPVPPKVTPETLKKVKAEKKTLRDAFSNAKHAAILQCFATLSLLVLSDATEMIVFVMIILGALLIGTIAIWRRRRWGAIVLLILAGLGIFETIILALWLFSEQSDPLKQVPPTTWLFVAVRGMFMMLFLDIYTKAATFLKQESTEKAAEHVVPAGQSD